MFRFNDNVRPQVERIVSVMQWANGNQYASQSDVYGSMNKALDLVVIRECGQKVWDTIEHSRHHWNFGGNESWLIDVEVAIENALQEIAESRSISVTTPDGFTFYRLPDGSWVDNLNPDYVDMSFPSDADLAESLYDDSVRVLELLIEIGDTIQALDFANNAPDCEPGKEAEHAAQLKAELSRLQSELSAVR